MNTHNLHAQIRGLTEHRYFKVSMHRAIERAVHQPGYVSLKSEQLKVVVGITDGRLFCFCSATSRVREEPVLCVFACSV